PQVKSIKFLNHDDAFMVYKHIVNNDPNLVGSITAADLPESFRVAPKRAELTEAVREEYRTQQGVNDVATPGDALKTILDVPSKIRYGFYAVITILLLSSLFLIVNTIRLATFARRREIEVMKLVGASN